VQHPLVVVAVVVKKKKQHLKKLSCKSIGGQLR
jgi:hypothetical protein